MRDGKIRVLVVDDSALVRQTMTKILNSDRRIEVMGSAPDPYGAVEQMKRERPDVIVLDIEMPRMDGLTFLRRIMSQHPIPTVICSSLTESGAETALKALESGAIEVFTKPKIGTRQFLEESRQLMCDSVKAASMARLGRVAAPHRIEPKLTADAILAPQSNRAMVKTTEKVVLIGASTGGTEALRELLQEMPLDAPGIVVVQHMPESFTTMFAKRLNGICQITVKEAADRDRVLRGQALIAPGNRHTLLKRSGAQYHVEVRDGPLVCRHRPAVDVLFRSGARYAGGNAVGVIMTGMGDDGARGLLEMKQAGAVTIAQNESTCVVFGMPREAINRGAADRVLGLEEIAGAVLAACS